MAFVWDSSCTLPQALPSETNRQYARRRKDEGATLNEIAADLGSTWDATRNMLRYHRGDQTPVGPPPPPEIEGLTAEDCSNDEELWERALRIQEPAERIREKRRDQTIPFEWGPIAIAFLSDVHFGSSGVDYEAVRRDAEIVRDTPGMYAVYHGDGTDNWIVGKLQGLQRDQAIPHDDAIRLHKSWLGMIGEKLILAVPGNHDLWTKKIAGVEYVRDHLGNRRCLYHPYDITFRLKVGENEFTVQVRHKWKYGSVFNATHGLQVGWARGDVDYDIAVGGHTHIGTFFHDFHKHNKRRWAVLTGTYKRYDSWGEECGFPTPKDSGCGALVIDNDGTINGFRDLRTAADFLTFLYQRNGEDGA